MQAKNYLFIKKIISIRFLAVAKYIFLKFAIKAICYFQFLAIAHG